MKFQKKPIVIEAVQWNETDEALEFISNSVLMSLCRSADGRPHTLRIETPEGVMSVSPGDWIIKGVKGEFYPCKPDIFEMTYDPIAEHNNVSVPDSDRDQS